MESVAKRHRSSHSGGNGGPTTPLSLLSHSVFCSGWCISGTDGSEIQLVTTSAGSCTHLRFACNNSGTALPPFPYGQNIHRNRAVERMPKWTSQKRSYSFGFGGGNSRATTVSAKPMRLWAPSQNGLLAEWPQRQSEITVRPARPNEAPVGSTISNSPSMRMGPLFCGLILVGIFGSSHRLRTENRFLTEAQRPRRTKRFLLCRLCRGDTLTYHRLRTPEASRSVPIPQRG